MCSNQKYKLRNHKHKIINRQHIKHTKNKSRANRNLEESFMLRKKGNLI